MLFVFCFTLFPLNILLALAYIKSQFPAIIPTVSTDEYLSVLPSSHFVYPKRLVKISFNFSK